MLKKAILTAAIATAMPLTLSAADDPCGTTSIPGLFEACRGNVWSLEVWGNAPGASEAAYVVLTNPTCSAPPNGPLFIGTSEDGVAFSAKVAAIGAAIAAKLPVYVVYTKSMSGGGHRVVRIDVPGTAVCGIAAMEVQGRTPVPDPSRTTFPDPVVRSR